MVKVFVPRESAHGETRVAVTPETAARLVAAGAEVLVASGAGASANLSDAAYGEAGAQVVSDADTASAWSTADLVLSVAGPTVAEVGSMGEGAILISFLAAYRETDRVAALRDGGISALAMELVPRISRAQSMDALSSQASIAGYKAVLLAASSLDKYFPLMMTAAGTVKPARVVIMGAGVAGLQAIATARRLGAVVMVSDIREVVREQVESLGARFIDLPDMGERGEGEGGYAREVTPEFLQKQQAIVATHVAQADVVVTTALVPGRPAPRLVTEAMVKDMRDGAVIVDLAVEQGGNCVLSERGEEVVRHGVRIIGLTNLPATMPGDASVLYARNVLALVELLMVEGALALDLEDEILTGALLTHGRRILHAPTAEALGDTPSAAPTDTPSP